MERKHMLKKITALLAVFTMAISLAGCTLFFPAEGTRVKEYETSSEVSKKEEKVVKLDWDEALELADEYRGKMSLEEKVGQVFMLNLEQLDKRKGNYYEFITKITEQKKPSRSGTQNTGRCCRRTRESGNSTILV